MLENIVGETRERTIGIGLESEWRNYILYDWLYEIGFDGQCTEDVSKATRSEDL